MNEKQRLQNCGRCFFAWSHDAAQCLHKATRKITPKQKTPRRGEGFSIHGNPKLDLCEVLNGAAPGRNQISAKYLMVRTIWLV